MDGSMKADNTSTTHTHTHTPMMIMATANHEAFLDQKTGVFQCRGENNNKRCEDIRIARSKGENCINPCCRIRNLR